MGLIHASDYDPLIFPLNGDVAPAEIDRAQSIDPTVSLNREEVNEIGREDGLVGYVQGSPSVAYSLTQYEYGSMEFWRKITNKADSVQTITLNDFKTPAFDIVAYLTDVEGNTVGSLVYPKLRTAGFSISIGDPDAIVERSFDLIGEEAKIYQGDNKYWIYERHEAQSGSDDVVDLSVREPAINPDIDVGEADEVKYIERVMRVRGSVTTELTVTEDYTYSSVTKNLTLVSVLTSDVIKIYYTSATVPSQLWIPNDSDAVALKADSVSIYLYIPQSGKPSSSDYVYRLQSATIDVSFDRLDLKEIGNTEVVQRSINDQTVTVTLGRLLDQFTIEEVLRGEAPGYGVIDVEKFTDSASLIIKFFSDSSKQTFTYGMKIDNLSPTEVGNAIAVQEHTNADTTLESKKLTISVDNAELGNL